MDMEIKMLARLQQDWEFMTELRAEGYNEMANEIASKFEIRKEFVEGLTEKKVVCNADGVLAFDDSMKVVKGSFIEGHTVTLIVNGKTIERKVRYTIADGNYVVIDGERIPSRDFVRVGR